MGKDTIARQTNLDVIKIVAAFAIVVHHYCQCFKLVTGYAALNNVLFSFGFLVELFFIISGYFAAKTINLSKSLQKQYLKKLLRLYPHALITVIFTAIIMFMHYIIFGECIWGNKYTIQGIITSFLMVNQGWFIEYFPALNNPVWYICVLLWLYLLFYIIEFLFKNISTNVGDIFKVFIYTSIVIIGGLGWLFKFNLPFLYISDCRGYATFFMGVLIFRILKTVQNNATLERFISWCSFFCILLTFLVMAKSNGFNWYLWVFIVCPAILMYGVLFKQLSIKNTDVLSEITFQLYLWHTPCFYVFQFVLDVFQIGFEHSILSMIVIVVMCFIFSVFVYYYIDIPISKMLLKERQK